MSQITLQEPFRAVFYTPFYAALARDEFVRQGVAVKLITVGEPERAVGNLLSGAADLAWSGPMRVIRDHAQDPSSALVSFGAVVMRDPFLLVGNAPRPDFSLRDLAGLRLGVVSEVPTPWWCLQRDLMRLGINPGRLATVQDRSMAENIAALRAGELDVVQVFEPFASWLVAEGGAVWHAQASRGPTSYTAFYTLRPMLAARRPALTGMVRGLAAMQHWLQAAGPEEVAATVAGFFPDHPPALLEACIARYQGLGIWARTPIFPADAYEALEAAMQAAGAILRRPGFAACVDNTLAEEALA